MTASETLRQRMEVGCIVLLGLALRLFHLGRESVWNDEIFSIRLAQLPLATMLDQLARGDPHPPLHYLLLNLWFQIFGSEPGQARMISVLFGTISIPLLYLLTKRLFDHGTGVLAALLLTVSQMSIYYSQEARGYAQFLALSLVAITLFWIAFTERRSGAWWGFVAAAALLLFTHYYAVLVIASLVPAAVVLRRRYTMPRRWWIAGAFAIVFAFSLWAMNGVVQTLLRHPRSPDRVGLNWTVLALPNELTWFNNSRWFGLVATPYLPVAFLGFALLTIPALVALLVLARDPRNEGAAARSAPPLVLLTSLLTLPHVALAIAGGALHVQYSVRYLMFRIAPYYILAAFGLARIRAPLLRLATLGLILLRAAAALRTNYFHSNKADYRTPLAHFAANYQAGDVCIMAPPLMMGDPMPPGWQVYHRDGPALRISSFDEVEAHPERFNRIWLVWHKVFWEAKSTAPFEPRRQELEQRFTKIEANPG